MANMIPRVVIPPPAVIPPPFIPVLGALNVIAPGIMEPQSLVQILHWIGFREDLAQQQSLLHNLKMLLHTSSGCTIISLQYYNISFVLSTLLLLSFFTCRLC